MVAHFRAHCADLLTDAARSALDAMGQATFTVGEVTACEPDMGVKTRDAITGQTRFIVDTQLGNSAETGMWIATRLVPFDAHFCTTGALMPSVGELPQILLGKFRPATRHRILRGEQPLAPHDQDSLFVMAYRFARDAGLLECIHTSPPR